MIKHIRLKSGSLALMIGASLMGLAGCATTLPEVPKMTSEICRATAEKNVTTVRAGTTLFYKDDKNILFGVNNFGNGNAIWNPGCYNFWLYIADINGENCHLVTKKPEDAPSVKGDYMLEKAYLYKDKIHVEYNSDWSTKHVGHCIGYYKVNKDGTGEQDIDVNEFYRFSVSAFIPARAEFLKELISALATKDYEKAESLRSDRVGRIKWYLEEYIRDSSELSGERKTSHEMLLKEKEKLENIVGLSDPALCQLREKYIAAINNDKYDDATKIFDLIERMEKKYKPELAQEIHQTVQVVQEEQSQLPQKIIVEHQEAPSVGKQMRALSTMAAGLDGGITPKAQNAWMGLFGLGDFIDASDKN